tara:strand:+ start:1397 stop:2344 length:948 start_codon:yes stop_codon:yes gene_type:complete
MEKRVIIFGGTGFLGISLAHYLKEFGYTPVLVARNIPDKDHGFEIVRWDAREVGEWKILLNRASAIVNLAGKSVNCIKTPDNCDAILRSRLESTMAIGKALEQIAFLPKVWVQMSTAHIYGDPAEQICTENSSLGYGLAPFVGKEWENTFLKVKPKEMREVRLRTSFVIGKEGGALVDLKRIAKLGMGGKTGSGQQGMSWIHQADFNAIVKRAIEKTDISGVYIVSAPQPVSNTEFMRKLRTRLKIPIGLPTPTWLAHFGAKYIFKTDPELALYGRYVSPKRLIKEGFTFKFDTIDQALQNVLAKNDVEKQKTYH